MQPQYNSDVNCYFSWRGTETKLWQQRLSETLRYMEVISECQGEGGIFVERAINVQNYWVNSKSEVLITFMPDFTLSFKNTSIF